jgi:hypothetical protein
MAVSSSSFAQVRSSSNYQLEADSINVGGGLSDSTNFSLESTAGEVATGRSTSTNFSLQAGYQQLDSIFISLTGGSGFTMAPDLPGLTGGTSNGSTTFTVTTDSPTGYQLTLQATNAPAMQKEGGVSIANYNSGSVADFAFTIPAASAVFGFSPEGIDVADIFLDNTVTCGVGTTETSGACWAGASTTPVVIAEATSPNQPTGANTTIEFQVGLANGAGIESGVYTATTTVTALPL